LPQLVPTVLTSGALPVATVKLTSISNLSLILRPAAIISSNMTRSLSAASTSTRQRGSKGKPSTSSPGRMATPQSPFMFTRLSPSSGIGCAQSGFFGLT
jgi:hypothetical protein